MDTSHFVRKYTVPLLVGAFMFGLTGMVALNYMNPQQDTDVRARATAATTPKITRYDADAFSDEKLDTAKWNPQVSVGTTVTENANQVVNIVASAGKLASSPKVGHLTYRQKIDANKDFFLSASVARPNVTGAGYGSQGVSFIASGKENVTISWIADAAKSNKLNMTVRGANKLVLKNVTIPLEEKGSTDIVQYATLRIARVGQTYIAGYKLGPAGAPIPLFPIGSVTDPSFGGEGYMSLMASNLGTNGMFPAVVSRFDDANLGWQDDTATAPVIFSDIFTGGSLDTASWTVSEQTVSLGTELLRLDAAAGKVNIPTVILKRDIPNNSDFNTVGIMLEPVVTGTGKGVSAIRFTDLDKTIQKSVTVRWVVDADEKMRRTANLTFSMTDTAGNEVGFSRVPAPDMRRATFRLARTGKTYVAGYKNALYNDPDLPWIPIGTTSETGIDTAGRISLFASNATNTVTYPGVLGRFKSIYLNYSGNPSSGIMSAMDEY